MTRNLAVVVLMILAVIVSVAAKVKVQAEGDKTFAFASLKTWTWNPSGAGDVKVWVSSKSDPAPIKRAYEPVIMQAVDDQLSKRGFARAGGSPPDFYMTYYVLVTLGMSAQEMGQFLPAVTEWGVPPFTPSTTAFKTYPDGSIVLDVTSRAADRVVWRGLAQSEIDLDKSEAERVERLRDIIKEMLSKFPPKK
jgi:hypothetical protein